MLENFKRKPPPARQFRRWTSQEIDGRGTDGVGTDELDKSLKVWCGPGSVSQFVSHYSPVFSQGKFNLLLTSPGSNILPQLP
jgi:hypothetical protein